MLKASGFTASARGQPRESNFCCTNPYQERSRMNTRDAQSRIPCQCPRTATRARLLLAQSPYQERSRMTTRDAQGLGIQCQVRGSLARATAAGTISLPRALADEHARSSRPRDSLPLLADSHARATAAGTIPYQERSRMTTRDAQGLGIHCQCSRKASREQLLLAPSPYQERSRMNTRDAQGLGIHRQCSRTATREQHLLAQVPARALADEHARGSKAHLRWHSSPVRALADEHARGSRGHFAGTALLPRAHADGPARGSRTSFAGTVSLPKRSRKDTRDAQGPENTALRRPSRRRDGSSLHDPFCDGPSKSDTSTTSSTSPRRLKLSCLRMEMRPSRLPPPAPRRSSGRQGRQIFCQRRKGSFTAVCLPPGVKARC